jgi:NAD(P)-dependent dehydrogenase (short-subunit alcohol dehydrogenase family)
MTGVWNCLRAQISAFSPSGGSIVVISSVSGVVGFPGAAAYSASKFGVIGLCRSVSKEYGTDRVRVNCIAP